LNPDLARLAARDDDLPMQTFVARLGRTGECVAAALLCALTTAVAWPLSNWLAPANIVMLFLLAVVVAAVWLSRWPAVLAAFLSVALFDFFFVPPQFSFAVNDAQYVVTFAVMLVVALTIGQLTTSLKQRFVEAQRHAAQQAALYDLAKTLSGALTGQQCIAAVEYFVARRCAGRVAVLVPDDHDVLALAAGSDYALSDTERAAVEAVHRSEATVDAHELGRDDGERLILPLAGATRRRGVMLVAVAPGSEQLRGQQSLMHAVAALLTTAIERLHYVEVARASELDAQSERLRSGILAALSHDVRTPLTAMYGLADSLAIDLHDRDGSVRETALALRDQALQLNGMVTNLLDMARIQAGKITLRREWQPLDEVLGASIRFCAAAIGDRRVQATLDPDLPLVEIDAVLIERVLCNLIENAAKYSPATGAITIAAAADATSIRITVSDSGPGFPAERLGRLFTLFERGVHEGSVGGMGVGLAICRAIVEAHGGRIAAANGEQGGGQVSFTLPRGTPPAIDIAVAAEASP